VCLHGVTAHGARFASLASGLARRFHVVAPDLRGHGRSSWDPPWSIEQHLEDLIDAAPPEAAMWLGHSFGGRLLLELALRRPERVLRGVLLDPSLWVPPGEARRRAELLHAEAAFSSVAAAIAAHPGAAALTGRGKKIAEADFAEHLERGADGLLRFRFSRGAAVTAYGEMTRTPPVTPLRTPLRVIRAEDSEVCPQVLIESCRATAGELLSSGSVPGGHNVMWSAPEQTTAEIISFLTI
jgi:lipase